MFRLLYDNLYTKKELAIVRELLSNAIDAHVRAGTTNIPIRVHLPTTLEPWFEVEDSGTGLSVQGVLSLYMNYGNSDKIETDLEIGGYGVGSKAPYCYTDQFTVKSRYEGMEYTFQAFLKEDGTPACMLIEQNPTNKHNGLTVIVPTGGMSANFTEFDRAFNKVAVHSLIPIESNAADPDKFDDTFEVYLDDIEIPGLIRVLRRKHSRSYRDPEIVQGIVPYTYDKYVMRDYLSDAAFALFCSNEYLVHAEINTVDITVSRETLSMGEEDKKALAKLLDAVGEKLIDHMIEVCDTAKTWYEWQIAASTIPIHKIPLPARFKKFSSNGDTTLDLPKTMFGAVSKLKATYRMKAGYRITPLQAEHIQFYSLHNMSHILVKPKASWPYTSYMQQYIKDAAKNNVPDDWDVLVVTGDIDEIKAYLNEAGVETPVWPIPKIVVPRAKRGSGQLLGAATYWHEKILHTSNGWKKTYASKEPLTKIGAYLDDYDESEFMVLVDNYINTDYIVDCLEHEIFRVNKDVTISLLHIPEAHNKVREKVVKAYPGNAFIGEADEVFPIDQKMIDYYYTLKEAVDYTGRSAFRWLDTSISYLKYAMDEDKRGGYKTRELAFVTYNELFQTIAKIRLPIVVRGGHIKGTPSNYLKRAVQRIVHHMVRQLRTLT